MSRYRLDIYEKTNTMRQIIIGQGELVAAKTVRRLNSDDTLEFTVDRRSDCVTYLSQRNIVRLVDIDSGSYRSYRIAVPNDERTEENKLFMTVMCEHIKYDLTAQIHNAAEEIVEQTPTAHMTKVLTGSGFTVGTVTPTAKITVPYNFNTRLADLEAIRALTEYDLVVNEDLTIDLESAGSDVGASIRYRKNMLSVKRTIDRIVANMAFGTGGEGSSKQIMTIAEATHRITAIVSLTVTLDSDKVVSSADSLNGFYVEKPNGTFTQITDCNKQTSAYDQLVLASVADLSVGDAIKIRTSNSATARLEYIPDAVSRAAYGDVHRVYRNTAIQEIRNIVGPASSSALSGTYTTGLCEGWTAVGSPTTTENTNTAYARHGSKSQKVEVSALAAPSNTPTAATGAAGSLTGAYQYKKTWRTADGETTASSATSTVNPSSETVDVGRNESPPSQATHWVVYRTLDGGSTFYYVADVAIGTETYNDNIPDSLITVVEPVSNKAAGAQGVQRSFTAVADKEYSAVCWVWVTSGQVRFELVCGTETFPSERVESAKRATPVVAGDQLWIIAIQGIISDGTTGYVRVLSHEGAATFYVDAVMVAESAYSPSEDVFVADNSATQLWYETYNYLQDGKNPRTTYDVGMVDLFEFDKAGYSSDQIEVGDTITVKDEDLGIDVDVRCIGKNQDVLEPQKSSVELSTAPSRFTDLLQQTRLDNLSIQRSANLNGSKFVQETATARGATKQAIIGMARLTE